MTICVYKSIINYALNWKWFAIKISLAAYKLYYVLHYPTFINQAARYVLLALRSLHSFFSLFAPRCNWLSEGRLRRRVRLGASKQITRGWFCPLQFASNILSYPHGLPASPSTFLKLLLSALCFINYRNFHFFRNRLYVLSFSQR